jgi:hypothetical protein
MYNMSRRARVASVALGSALLAVFAIGQAFGAPALDSRGALSASDIRNARLDTVTEIRDPSVRLLSVGVTAADALEAAANAVGRKPEEGRAYSAIAAKYFDDDARSVYVIVFSGGLMPVTRPASENDIQTESLSQRIARITGVVIDAGTGEFLRGFMYAAGD